VRRSKIRKPKTPKAPRKGAYNLPNDSDIEKINKEILKHSKSLDEDGRPKPLTENQLKQLIRSAVRQKWMYCPSKLSFLAKAAVPDYDETTRRRMKYQCNICKEWFTATQVQVDHIKQEESFSSLEDALTWAGSILNAGGDEDLQILCEYDHSIKTLLDGCGRDFRDPEDWAWGVLEKQVNEVCRGTGCPEKKWLEERGVVPGKNLKTRREQIIECLKEEAHNV
jgi:5-methylcytosine-specific restriction endonuclease McrA